MKGYTLHIILSLIISFLIAVLIRFLWARDLMILALPMTMLIGIAKELIWDKWMKRGTFEWKDLWFDAWGAGGGTILAYMIL